MRGHNTTNGLLLLDKPAGMTSHEAVQKVRKIVGQPEVGHTGTLDPLAEGLLPMCLGRFTKLAGYLQDEQKCYEAELYLGMTSPTCDAEGLDRAQSPRSVPVLSASEWDQVLNQFRGEIQQRVPTYSAVRIEGKRLYDLARAADRNRDECAAQPELEAPIRQVTIFSLKITSIDAPLLRLAVHCSKGTYIRALARDIGEALGCGAYLSALRRTSVGRLSIEQAVSFDQLRHAMMTDTVGSLLVNPFAALPFPSVYVAADFAPNVGLGRMPHGRDIDRVDREIYSGEIVMLRDPQGNLLALARSGSHWSQPGSDGPLPFAFERVLV